MGKGHAGMRRIKDRPAHLELGEVHGQGTE